MTFEIENNFKIGDKIFLDGFPFELVRHKSGNYGLRYIGWKAGKYKDRYNSKGKLVSYSDWIKENKNE